MSAIAGAVDGDEEAEEEHRQRNIGDCRQPLPPEMLGAFARRAEAADFAERRAHVVAAAAHSQAPRTK